MAALVVTQRAVRKKAMGPESKGMGIWLIFLLLSGPVLSVRASSASIAEYSCDDGCPQQNFPVCGVDGEWYQNKCIAYCSGVSVDFLAKACQGSPMPFDDQKPGPQGSESNGLGIKFLAKDVINAFRSENLRYIGRIKLAKELAPRPDPSSGPISQPEPDSDGRGNWKVDAVRCTSMGDVYKGTMAIPMAAMDLHAAEPSPIAPWFKKPIVGFGSRASRDETLVQESGSYTGSSSPAAAGAQELQQEKQGFLRPGKPNGFVTALKGMWGNMTSLFKPKSGSNSSSSSSTAAPVTGDNHVFSTGSSSSSSEEQGMQEDMELLKQYYSSSGNASDSSSSSSGGNRRLLEIIGADDRFACDRGYPYTAIGQIQVVDNTGLYICTGTLIKPDKVLTAAHCVWNTKRNAFYYNLNFAPGRYREDGSMVNPWGVVPWKSVTVFDAFKKNPATWDVAVVTLSKKLGSLTGYMGMAAGCSSNTQLTVAGYPQDEAQGTCMANTCKIPYLDCNALTNIHTCDTIMGMSGSPLWDNKNRIRMIHVAGIQGKQENRGTTVTQFLVNTISKW